MFTFVVLLKSGVIRGDFYDTAKEAIEACVTEVELLQFHNWVEGRVALSSELEVRVTVSNGFVITRKWKMIDPQAK